jgi:hypothetical protein
MFKKKKSYISGFQSGWCGIPKTSGILCFAYGYVVTIFHRNIMPSSSGSRSPRTVTFLGMLDPKCVGTIIL